MITIHGMHFDLVVFAWSVVPSAALAAILLRTRDALREINTAHKHAIKASS